MSNNVKKQASVHVGHRERMRRRFLVSQGKDFNDHEMLEMLLYYAIPRGNTNEVAHNLLNEFGSLRNVCNAEPARIERVVGAGPATSLFISFLFALRKRIDLEKYDLNRFVANSTREVGEFLMEYYRDKQYEEVCAMLLDNSFRLIEFKSLSTGSVNSSSFDVRSLTKHALRIDATHVILSHNHPSGDTAPSMSDRDISLRLDASLRAVGIILLDHIIVTSTSYKPMMSLGMTTQNMHADPQKYRDYYQN
ncbi:MAG: RadC family protein [Eubacteriales bacterium]